MTTTTKLPYYKFNRLLSYNGVFNAVLGTRGTGKTFGAKLLTLNHAIKNKRELIYLRRYKEDVDASKETFFTDLQAAGYFTDLVFKVEGRRGYWDRVRGEGEKQDWKICVRFMSLSTQGRQKSVSFPNVDWIIYDEFVLEKGLVHYLPREVELLVNMYSTVDRNSDRVRVLMLANSVSVMNPYFLAWNIEPKGGSTEEWITRFNNYVVVHIDQSAAFKDAVKETRFGQFIDGTEYGSYALDNEFRDNHALMLAKKPAHAEYRLTVETLSGSAIAVWLDREKWEWYGTARRPKKENIFTQDPNRVSPDRTLILKNDRLIQPVKSAFRHGRMFFDKAQTRNAFYEVLDI